MNKAQYKKTVIINRAVPGSGKTSISRCITSKLQQEGLSVVNHSTDDFFMQGGKYCFDLVKLGDYHKQNLQNFCSDLEAGVDIVICDNTNLLPWQTSPYTEAARRAGYQIIFLNLLPRELEQHVQAQMVTEEKPDAHGVPEEQLARFIDEFLTYNPLLKKSEMVDHAKHFTYCWDEQQYRPMVVGTAEHFDADVVVTVKPEDYHQIKANIGNIFMDLIKNPDFFSKKCLLSRKNPAFLPYQWRRDREGFPSRVKAEAPSRRAGSIPVGSTKKFRKRRKSLMFLPYKG